VRLTKLTALACAVAALTAAAAFGFAIIDYPPPPNGAVGKAYSYVFKPYEGAPPYAFYFKGGDLPPGLKIELDGTMHGTPTQPGTFDFTVEASQYCAPDPKCLTQKGFTVKVRDALNITTPSPLKSAAVGAPYNATLTVAGYGGVGMAWSIVSGFLPPGVTLAQDPLGGSPGGQTTISGTPSSAGTYTFTVKVDDTDGFQPNRATTKQFTLAVVAALAASAPAQLGTAIVGKAYRGATPSATGGLPPYKWSATGGTVPPGLAVNPGTGSLVGKPTAAGIFSYTLGVVDADGRSASVNQSVTVLAALDVATTQIRAAKLGKAYKQKLRATGGKTPYRWKLKRGKLPAGLHLDRSTGIISGTAKAEGTFRFAVSVSDASSQVSSQALVLRVRG
jgi:hypothetical protein